MMVGFIGAGNMATGLARGWHSASGEAGAPDSMAFTDAAPGRAQELADEVSGEALDGTRAVAEASDLVVLAVKPNVLDEVASDLEGTGVPVLSILAGTSLEKLQAALPGLDVVRVMPNLGAQLRQGVYCLAFADGAGDALRDRVTRLLGTIGEVVELEEEMIDPATTIMGCSPGYFALMAEALLDEGKKLGMTEDQLKPMISKSMAATGGLLDVRDAAELKRAVASPGGMTEAGLETLEERDFRGALAAAVEASLDRVR